MINWESTKEEFETIAKIAKRANAMAKQLNVKYELMTINMDISACHLNGCELRLNELLNADNSNFAHDIFGIRANINRKTGKLENCFLPRYAK